MSKPKTENVLDAIRDLHKAAEDAHAKFGPAAGDIVIKDSFAESIWFVAAKIRQKSSEYDGDK